MILVAGIKYFPNQHYDPVTRTNYFFDKMAFAITAVQEICLYVFSPQKYAKCSLTVANLGDGPGGRGIILGKKKKEEETAGQAGVHTQKMVWIRHWHLGCVSEEV